MLVYFKDFLLESLGRNSQIKTKRNQLSYQPQKGKSTRKEIESEYIFIVIIAKALINDLIETLWQPNYKNEFFSIERHNNNFNIENPQK
jgi:hypothetical protein